MLARPDAGSVGSDGRWSEAAAHALGALLDAPVKRVAATDTFVGYAPSPEDAILPQVETFRRAVEEVLAY